MKKLIRPLFNSYPVRVIRNLSGFRPVNHLWDLEKQYLASDLFIWRSGKEYSTIFKASNILQKYYQISSHLKFVFYNKEGVFLRDIDLEFSDDICELNINKGLIGEADLGTFCVLNVPEKTPKSPINVTNRCYIGYGKSGRFSMVHGNIIALMAAPTSEYDKLMSSLRPAVSERKGKYSYFL